MIVKGDILFNKKFIYETGATGEKLLVILNSPSQGEPFLFVKTTSQQYDRPKTPGCIGDIHRSLFFIPAKKDFFRHDTWVQIYSFEAIDYDYIVSHSDIRKIGSLKHKTINEIMDCLFKTWGKNIASWQKKLLQPSLNGSMLKLKERFRKLKPS